MFISCDWGTSAFRLRLLESSAGGLAPGDGQRPGDSASLPTAKVLTTLSTDAGIAATHALWQRSGLPETERLAFYRAVLEKTIGQLAASRVSRESAANNQAGSAASGESGDGTDLHGVPVIISGMASSSIGMLELPYKPLPFDVSGLDLTPTVLPATKGSPRIIYLMPGVRSADDVMRGEETQLIGCCVNRPDLGFNPQGRAVDTPGRVTNTLGERVFVFPGTHSKHIDVRDGQTVAFKTYMTGELFALLTQQSVLAASVTAPGKTGSAGGSAATLPEAFFAGIAASRDTSLLHTAFLTRTNQLFHKYNKEDNYHFLSGLLIGEELRDLADAPEPENASRPIRPFMPVAVPPPGPEALRLVAAPSPGVKTLAQMAAPSRRPITLVASSPLRESYAAALDFLGFRQVAAIDADEALIAGHCAIFARFGATFAPVENS